MRSNQTGVLTGRKKEKGKKGWLKQITKLA